MAEILMHQPRDWVVQINSVANADTSLRVATPLLNTKPEAYIPQMLCFGPYHIKDSCSAGSRNSVVQAYKGKSAAILSQKLQNCGKRFDNVVEMMERMLAEIGRFYDLVIKDGEDTKNFTCTMTVDSSFLLLFALQDRRLLPSGSGQNPGSPSLVADTISFCKIYRSPIRHDILKLENQIPLFVLKGVFEEVKETLIPERYQDFNGLLLKLAANWTPFFFVIEDDSLGDKPKVILDAEPHLLACMQTFVSRFLHIKTDGEDNGAKRTLLQQCNNFLEKLVLQVCHFLQECHFLQVCLRSVERPFLKGFSAVQLDRAGIKFKSFYKQSDTLRFDKQSGTLYLPQINAHLRYTEVFLRNMVALEFNDAKRPKSVTRYIGLMGCLIQSPDDVRLLIDRHVISRDTFALTDEYSIKMWHDLHQPFIRTPFLDLGDDHSEVAFWEVLGKNYYKTKMKRTLLGLFDYVSSWKFMAPVGVFLGLAMTAIQTYCSVYPLAFSGNTSRHAA